MDLSRFFQAVQDAKRDGKDVFEIAIDGAEAAHQLMTRLAEHSLGLDFEVMGETAHLSRLGILPDAITFDGWPLFRGAAEHIGNLRITVRPKKIEESDVRSLRWGPAPDGSMYEVRELKVGGGWFVRCTPANGVSSDVTGYATQDEAEKAAEQFAFGERED